MDEFTKQYIVTALWSSTGDDDRPLDDDHGPDDLSPETLRRMTTDCQEFQDKHYDKFGEDPEYAGHDFWLTRNGHGAGFWDGDWPEHGEALTAACKGYGECYLYVGDDKQIYIA